MKTIGEIHDEAMRLAERALISRRAGREPEALNLFRRALGKERKAAELVDERSGDILSRAVLHRSAGWMAMNCAEYGEAHRLATAGLAGSPPAEVAAELRELRSKAGRARRAGESSGKAANPTVSVHGRLQYADETATEGRIKLIETRGGRRVVHQILVPVRRMGKIIKPLWGEEVIVSGVRQSRGDILLKGIAKAPA